VSLTAVAVFLVQHRLVWLVYGLRFARALLCRSLVFFPCMLPLESITLTGAEQFCTYKGYAFDLDYGA
jgi:hypothetical protein